MNKTILTILVNRSKKEEELFTRPLRLPHPRQAFDPFWSSQRLEWANVSKKQSEMKKDIFECVLETRVLPGVDEPSPNKTLEVTVHIIFKPWREGY